MSQPAGQRAAAPGIASPQMKRPANCDHPVEFVPTADGQDKAH